MANWISSKLRAAETILQQIDQQAAKSPRKVEKPETHYQAAELQTNMMEVADLEKQKHDNTRMEVHARLAGLEATKTLKLQERLLLGRRNLRLMMQIVEAWIYT
ncbi:unnamed protein product [Arabis nemorensis]|uniref:Uncharacterized protein n=1 Tax=Arabis nemorensis TaxID=586526 RepID=A0A565ASV0_9BRAS|nr:unnamed protein product [Arabis nemorensis]